MTTCSATLYALYTHYIKHLPQVFKSPNVIIQTLSCLREPPDCLYVCLHCIYSFLSIKVTLRLCDWLIPFMSIDPFGCLSVLRCIAGAEHNAVKWTDSIIDISRCTDCCILWFTQLLFVCWFVRTVYLICKSLYGYESCTHNSDISEIMWH